MDLMGIGAFSRLSGLSPSTLRFYDDCGLLPPAWVNPDSGYRQYCADQVRTATLIGRLRMLDVPLPMVRQIVVDPTSSRSAELLALHWSTLETRLERARLVLASVHALIEQKESETMSSIQVGAADLRAACQRVQWAIYSGHDAPAITAVLIAVEADLLRLAATNKSALAVSTVGAVTTSGTSTASVDGGFIRTLAVELPDAGVVLMSIEDDAVRVIADGNEWAGQRETSEFPDYNAVLPGAPSTEVVVSEADLTAALGDFDSGFVSLTADSNGLRVAGLPDGSDSAVPALVSGEGLSLGFDPLLLAAAARAQGGQLRLSFGTPVTPVLITGETEDFAVVMPVRLG